VNPNGVEVGAAIALWASGAVLVQEATQVIDRRLVTRIAVAGVVLVLSRPASPLFGLLIAIALVALADRAGLRALLRARSAQIAAASVALAAAAQLVWNQVVQPNYYGVPIPDTVSRNEVARFAIGKTPDYFRQMIGVFGAPDMFVNTVTILLWSMLLGGVVLLAVAIGRRRTLLVMGGTLAVAIAMPIVADVSQADRFTFAWQGRYTIPLAVGIPLLAGIAVATSDVAGAVVRRRLLAVVAGIFALGQALAFAEFLQRYTVGVDGPLLFVFEVDWSPPIPAAFLLVGATASVIGLALYLVFGAGSDRRELVEQLVVGDALASSDRGPVQQHT
jgi:hypothetical protein